MYVDIDIFLNLGWDYIPINISEIENVLLHLIY